MRTTALVISLLAPVSHAQEPLPRVLRGNVEHLGAPSSWRGELDSLRETLEETAWAGYAVPMVEGGRDLCCGGVCRLDDGDRQWSSQSESGLSRELVVLYRIENRALDEVRIVSSDCPLDTGTLTLYWWSSVPLEESLELLASLVRESPTGELGESALHALARHAGERADALLDDFAAARWPEALREKATFWMGAVRGDEGFRRLAARFDAATGGELREHMVFAMHLSKAEAATEKLVDVARNDPDRAIRMKALFWLAQKAGERAAETIAGAVTEDPELEVKKKAVFALSQLPADEGIPLLIEVAETHPRAEIRERAFFWLGQSGVPRALAFIENVLLPK